MYNQYGNEMNWVPTLMSRDGRSLYRILVDAITRDIEDGVLVRGFKMPPQRVLANHLGINHGTVTRAYKVCEEQGLLKAVTGKGTYVAASPGLPVSMLVDYQSSDIISMGMALPLYEMNGVIEDALKEIYDRVDFNLAMQYSPPEGHVKHRYVAANWLKQYHIHTEAKNILITSGTQNALSIILLTLFEKGQRIAVDAYTYTGLKSLAAYEQIILVPVDSDGEGMSPEALDLCCKRERIQGIYLMSDHHNPTTVTLNEERRAALAQVISKYKLKLIEDATYSFSVEHRLRPISSYIPDQSFFILGTSKAINPTFRISYVVSPEAYVPALQSGLNNIIWMASPLCAEIISLFQSTGMYDDIVHRKIEILKERNKCFENILKEYDIISSLTSSFGLLNLPQEWTDSEFEQRAFEKGVQVFAANRFYVGVSQHSGPIRLSISAPESIDEMKRGLEIIKGILTEGKIGKSNTFNII